MYRLQVEVGCMHGLDGIKSTQPPLPYETLVTGMATSVQPTMRKDHPGHRETMCGIFPLCSNGGDVGGLLAMRRFFFGQQGSQDETLIEVQRTCWLHGKALLRNPLESTGNPPRQVYAKGCRGILSNRGFVAPMKI